MKQAIKSFTIKAFILTSVSFAFFISLSFFSPDALTASFKNQVLPGKILGTSKKASSDYDLALEKITVNSENLIILTIRNKGNSPIPDDLFKRIKITIMIDSQPHTMPLTGQAGQKIMSIGDPDQKLRSAGSELTLNTGLKLDKKSLVEVTIDSDNALQESDEQNNKLRTWLEPVKTIQIGAAARGIKAAKTKKENLEAADQPDLKIERAEIIYTDELKHRADLIVQIKNVGSRSSAPIDYLVEIKNEAHNWKPLPVGSGQWKYLNPDETAEGRISNFFSLNYFNPKYFSPGENQVRITLDPQNRQTEMSKENNTSVINFKPLLPDLKITSLNLETRDLRDGTSEAIVHLTIKNVGEAYPLQRQCNSTEELTNKERNFLNLTIKRSDGQSLTIRLAGPNFSVFGLKNYLLAPGGSKEFILSMPEASIYDRNSPSGYTDVPARISNNFLLGDINITFTIDEGQLLFDADYSNNSFTYNYANPPVFKLHPQSPSAYINLEKEMNFYLISNLDLNKNHRGEILGSGMGPDLSFYWGSEPIKVNRINLLRSMEEKYKASPEPLWEIVSEMPRVEGQEELKARWGNVSFLLGKIRIYGAPVINEYPDELIEPGKKYSFKGKNFISPEHFGKMFQNYRVKLEGGGYVWPYYFVSENEFQTEETNFDCSYAPGQFELIVTKSYSGKPEHEIRVAFFPFGLGLKPQIMRLEPTTARPGQTIELRVENYCDQWPLKITEFKLNDLRLDEISRKSLSNGAVFTLKLPEGATTGKITCKYGNAIIASPVELVIKND